jgi:hypothetical protein
VSDDCYCDKCGARGRRRRFTFAPEGWLFIETLCDEEEPEQGTCILKVCSKECAMGMWEQGPGDLNRTKPYPPEHGPPPYKLKPTEES